MSEQSPCNYGGDHLDGNGGGIHYYEPDTPNALDATKGAWIITLLENKRCQVDYCHACGAKLPLAPLGQLLGHMRVE